MPVRCGAAATVVLPRVFAAARDAAYQSIARGARLLTAHFQSGDLIVFTGFAMHGSLDNHSPAGRVRLSVDVRYQLATDPADDPRFFGPNPVGAAGGGYGEQTAAQPLDDRSMPDVVARQPPVPPEFLGPLVDSTACLSDAAQLRRSFFPASSRPRGTRRISRLRGGPVS